eukprot:TRINITY_DN5127_c0_g1_i2.p1 TRINITY_DN5127_c0_g1~~TRINITY_DN5127_c0_g1_i2.p1  ORF type:complete len:157 (+),score=49.97 TRINITY_DN5127_c0_g1_i2:58-471(+)
MHKLTSHFETGTFKKKEKVFLEEREYALALDSLVKACVDILICDNNKNKVLIAKRCIEPQPDWWFIGGRMLPGETLIQTALRILSRELSIDLIDINQISIEQIVQRFETVTHFTYLWFLIQLFNYSIIQLFKFNYSN